MRTTFVFGSDENPFWTAFINDAIAILVRNDSSNYAAFKNIATLTMNDGSNVTVVPFLLQELAKCDDLFLENDVAPAVLDAFPGTRREIPGASYYDHEFGGASRPLTRESIALPPGNYTIKFVIQDVTDQKVDSALFVKRKSLTLYPVCPGDYNLDGVVNAADYSVWRDSCDDEKLEDARFEDGDGNGDGDVTLADYTVWLSKYGATGNGDYSADFNRDGVVDAADYYISGRTTKGSRRVPRDSKGTPTTTATWTRTTSTIGCRSTGWVRA